MKIRVWEQFKDLGPYGQDFTMIPAKSMNGKMK